MCYVVKVEHSITINWQGNALSPISLVLKGSGGHPSLEVEEVKLDFSRIYAGEKHIRIINLKNNGNAETMCNLKTDCHFIDFDPAPPLFVGPFGSRKVSVILIPEEVGGLHEEVIIESLETKVIHAGDKPTFE